MPSGGITITPGKILAPRELVSNAKLNQGFRPVGRVNEGAITERELNAESVRVILNIPGRNLLCNGGFILQQYPTGPLSGVVAGGFDHDYHTASRWVIANDANRIATRESFLLGQTEVPGSPLLFLRWAQSAAVAMNPAYFGQRLEDARRLSGQEVTFSAWVRSGTALSLTPEMRQFFGSGGGISPEVLTTGIAVALTAGAWQRMVQTFTVPSVTGKFMDDNVSFVEFRIVVPQAVSFTIDFANVQLEVGSSATAFEEKFYYDDLNIVYRYLQVIQFYLSDSITTHGRPFANLPVPMRLAGGTRPALTLLPSSGSGGVVGYLTGAGGADSVGAVVQNVNHSAIVAADVILQSELYDA